MDATTNDIPPSAGFAVQSFPTIKFKKAGSKEFMDFNGDRTLEGFVEFIGLNAKNSVPVNLDAVNETKEETAEAPKKAAHEEVNWISGLDERRKWIRSFVSRWVLTIRSLFSF